VLNPLVTWFLRRGVSRPVAITIVVIVMLIGLTALFGVLAASLSEFSTMLPQYNKELTRKIVALQEMMPFLICISRQNGCCAGWIQRKS
jgi:predicted PurR-regulated permease PerM